MFKVPGEKLFDIILLTAGLCPLLFSPPAFAQEVSLPQNLSSWVDSTRAPVDSALAAWNEASAYETSRLRLLRWLTKNKEQAQSASYLQITEFLRDAETFANADDFVTAQILLESALALTNGDANPATAALSGDPRPITSVPTKWRWRREAVLGMDFWRQEFEIGVTRADGLFLAEAESLFVENKGNPFSGLRLELSRGVGAPSYLQTYALLKASRDYNSGEAELRAQQAFGAKTHGRFENRFESIRYLRDFDLRYWQNNSSALFSAELSKKFRLEIEEEIRLRRYQNEDELSRNYTHNEASLAAIYSAGFSSRLRARYSFNDRRHQRFAEHDYFEHRLETSWFKHSAQNSSIFIENLWRRRVYRRGISDSTYENTHQEGYLRADLRFGLGASAALRLESDFTSRVYPAEVRDDLAPDFLDLKANPQVQFKLVRDWQASIGYLFLLRQYEAHNSLLGYADYYAHGFTLGLDLFTTKGFLLSASNAFQVRTYPDVSADNLLLSSSYSDRNINSLLLFLSWTFHPNWQLGAFANYDNEISRLKEASDSRNTLFSVDVTYSF